MPFLLSARHEDLEVLTIAPDGTITTRYRRPDGVVHWHRQCHDLVPQILHLHGPLDAWCVTSVSLPSATCTRGEPEQLIALARVGAGSAIARYSLRRAEREAMEPIGQIPKASA